MAISFGPSDFLDKFDTGKFMATSGRADAIERANAFRNSAMVGGEGVTQIASNEARDILKNAQRSAQSTTNTAGAISGGLDLLNSVGSFGAAGGFGNFGGGTTSTSGIGSGVGQASLTPGVDTRSTFSNRINPIAGFGGVMNA